MSSTEQILSGVTIFVCLKLVNTFYVPMNNPDSILVPMSYDGLKNIQWMGEDSDQLQCTCGQFKVYNQSDVKKVVGRWYVLFMSNIPKTTDYCSQLTNIYGQCDCLGMDFDISSDNGYGTMVMFSTDLYDRTVTYEMMNAHMYSKNRLNFKRVVQRRFRLYRTAEVVNKGGYMIPNVVVIDSDNFNSYMTLMICLEGANRPIIINVVRNVDQNPAKAMKYLDDNNLYHELIGITHEECFYPKSIV